MRAKLQGVLVNVRRLQPKVYHLGPSLDVIHVLFSQVVRGLYLCDVPLRKDNAEPERQVQLRVLFDSGTLNSVHLLFVELDRLIQCIQVTKVLAIFFEPAGNHLFLR